MKNTFFPLLMMSFFMLSCNTVQKDPNILLINVDDMGWKDVGFMGSTYYETPNLDHLAENGIVFTQAYAAAANCAPSRACMMSGQWSQRHGIYTVNSSERGKSKNRKIIPTPNITTLADECFTLAEALQADGYVTCHAGKWHLTDDPRSQGFDFNIGGTHAGHPSSYYFPVKNVPLEANEGDYLTNVIMDRVIEFVEENSEEKFFLYYSPYAVHTPIHPYKPLLEKYENKPPSQEQGNFKYATMVDNFDQQIGRLMTALKEADQFNNTLILFTSDNGGVYKITKQRPLRAGKGSYYEGGIREPFFIHWPEQIKEAKISTVQISNLDIFPTLVDLLDIQLPADKILDGTSLMPLVQNETEELKRALFWHFPIYLEGGHQESQDPKFRTRPGSAVRYGDWKLIEYFENGDLELYHLGDDPGEANNLAAVNPSKTDELLQLLIQWRQETNAPVPGTINPKWLDPKDPK